jgi:polygalacturonase
MNMLRSLLTTGLIWLAATASWAAAPTVYDVRDYGAAADGKALATRPIQKAIDAAAAAGGGTVVFPPGTFRSGTLWLKNNVTLALEPGATLLGSADPRDYPEHRPSLRSYTDVYVCQSLSAGEGLEHVAIVGRGVIDGNGGAFRWKEYKNRPYVIRLVRCRDVRVEGIRLQNSPMWMEHYLACDQVRLRGVTVFNHVGYNNDGVDIDSCHDVSISECMFDSDDDGLCLKSTLDRPCRNVVVSNCVLSSHCNALKMGTESNGGFQDVTVTNCTICSPRFSESIYGNCSGMGGIALETVDGGILDRVTISNVTIRGVSTPIFLRLGNRARPFIENGPKPPVGALRNVLLSNIVATGASNIGCSITGVPGHAVENVSLSDIQITFDGGGVGKLAARTVPEYEARYPESRMFGPLPAYGFYCRHVNGLKLHNVRLDTMAPDRRHAMVCDDVKDLVVDSLDAGAAPDAAAILRLTQVEGAIVRNCSLRAAAGTFLKLEGNATNRVTLFSNEVSRAARIFEARADVPSAAISTPAAPQAR